jgi:hypothetical protein|tara:strand:- start:3904 stop:5484 length:1581 start_codon:yes stop_codon:yes gene_type:complete
MSDLKKILKEEYIKCATDPVYFMKKYCYIQHPQRGRIQFNLYPFQGKVLRLIKENPYNIILKSRQLGISTLSAGYSLWLMLFHENRNVLALATTQATARNLVSKVQFMYENLPSWLKISSVENNKLSLRLSNGSKIQAKSSNSEAARSEAVSLLIIDEAAFIDNIAETWASAQQTLATGGGAIVLSTPYGTGNWFHQMWVKAETDAKNEFLPIRLPWDVHPERDQSWRDKQDELLGDPRLAAQECDCDFSTSGDTVFYSEFLEYYEKTFISDPLEKRGADQNLWIWEPADYSRSYMVVADVARGDGKDYSGFHILDIENNVQVGEYKGQLGTKEFGHLLVGIATEYNNALLVVENASIGWSTIQTIIDREYSNLYYSPKSGEIDANSYFSEYMDTSKMTAGFSMTSRVRPICISKFQEAISDKGVTIQSRRLIEEMKVFIWKNGRAEAQTGYNDDLVMPFSIGQYMRDTAFKFKQHGIDLTKSMLNNTTTTSQKYSGGYSSQVIKNPYKVNNPYSEGGKEDISWLL